jgi:hypothetical protein
MLVVKRQISSVIPPFPKDGPRRLGLIPAATAAFRFLFAVDDRIGVLHHP